MRAGSGPGRHRPVPAAVDELVVREADDLEGGRRASRAGERVLERDVLSVGREAGHPIVGFRVDSTARDRAEAAERHVACRRQQMPSHAGRVRAEVAQRLRVGAPRVNPGHEGGVGPPAHQRRAPRQKVGQVQRAVAGRVLDDVGNVAAVHEPGVGRAGAVNEAARYWIREVADVTHGHSSPVRQRHERQIGAGGNAGAACQHHRRKGCRHATAR